MFRSKSVSRLPGRECDGRSRTHEGVRLLRLRRQHGYAALDPPTPTAVEGPCLWDDR